MWIAVECGETRKYSLTPRLEGSISSSTGLVINAVIVGDLVKQILPIIDDVITMYISDEYSMEYAVHLSDVAYAADFTLRGNKVQEMVSIIDLSWSSDDESIVNKAVKNSPDDDCASHDDEKPSCSSANDAPVTPEA